MQPIPADVLIEAGLTVGIPLAVYFVLLWLYFRRKKKETRKLTGR